MDFRSVLKSSYRFFQARCVKKYILPHILSSERLAESFGSSGSSFLSVPQASASGSKRIWFHAASVGELETLWPLIIEHGQRGNELLISILSESAKGTLTHLEKALTSLKAKLLFSGYAPWEGEWMGAFEKARPDLFVTAKYEAWPDLWISLMELRIPLAMVSVHARKSLRIAKKICQSLAGGLPDLYFFPCVPSEVSELQELFPQSRIEVAGEPRWDRVYSRLQKGNDRAKEVIQSYQSLQRPWGILGSAWCEDLKFLGSRIHDFNSTLWIVPHRVDEENLKKIEIELQALGLEAVRTSRSKVQKNLGKKCCVLVDEMGFLSELYSIADWAFVGGGFGEGVHSTIEPAIQGIPIASGPGGIEKFYEVQELSQNGQLSVLRCEKDLAQWIRKLQSFTPEQKKIWLDEAKSRLGATQKILLTLENFLNERASLAL